MPRQGVEQGPHLSPLNPRRVAPSAIESMADDIAAHGLLQNLVAYEDDGLLYVFAGGRRYGAVVFRDIKTTDKLHRPQIETIGNVLLPEGPTVDVLQIAAAKPR